MQQDEEALAKQKIEDILHRSILNAPLFTDVVFAKGDVPGHEFHGNQYSGGGGGDGKQSKSASRIAGRAKESFKAKSVTLEEKGYMLIVRGATHDASKEWRQSGYRVTSYGKGQYWITNSSSEKIGDNKKIPGMI